MIKCIIIAETQKKLHEAAGQMAPPLKVIESTIQEFSGLRLITSPMMSVLGPIDTSSEGFICYAEYK